MVFRSGGGNSSLQRTTGSDTEEVTEERVIRELSIVTTFSFVRTVKDKTRGIRDSLTFYNCRKYVSCEKTQETPIHLSKESDTMLTCLEEL